MRTRVDRIPWRVVVGDRPACLNYFRFFHASFGKFPNMADRFIITAFWKNPVSKIRLSDIAVSSPASKIGCNADTVVNRP